MASKDYVVKEVEIDLQSYWLVLKRRWLIALAVAAITTASAVAVATMQKKMYKAQAKLLFSSSSQASSLVGLEGSPRELKALTNRDDPLDTQVEVFRSIPIAEQVIQRLQLKDDEGNLLEPEALLAGLSAAGVPGTDVLQVTYQSTDPELAASVVNTSMDVYIQNDIQVERAAAVSAQEFIAAQLPKSETEVDKAESALRQFKEENRIVDLDVESRNTVEVLSNLDNSLTELRSQLADSTARSADIQNNLKLNSREAYSVGLVSESPGVQEILVQLQAVQSQLAIAQTRYEETHPEITNIRSQEDALLFLLQQRVSLALGDNQLTLPANDLQAGDLEQGLIADFLRLEAERSGLAQQVEELSGARSTQQARALILPGLEKQQRELERTLNAAQSTYETLLENLQQARVLENQNVGNARVVSAARVPKKSVSPSTKLYLLAGGVTGLLLGVMAAFLADLVDRSVKSVREGQELYGYPLLGVIPAWRSLNSSTATDREDPTVVVREPQTVPVIESYQALQANLKFSSLDKPLQTIAVTSAVAGEGKSEVVANLALTLAQLGSLVLIVDANIRSPSQHHVWNISELQGLSNFAAGQLGLKDAIVKKEPNLHVLTAGTIPPNPLAVLESKKMATLIDISEKAYDYIIIDTPAIVGLADTLTLAKMTDGVLVVMQPGLADADGIKTARAMLMQSKQRVLGIVANGIDVGSKPDRYFYHNQEYIDSRSQKNSLVPIEENGHVEV